METKCVLDFHAEVLGVAVTTERLYAMLPHRVIVFDDEYRIVRSITIAQLARVTLRLEDLYVTAPATPHNSHAAKTDTVEIDGLTTQVASQGPLRLLVDHLPESPVSQSIMHCLSPVYPHALAVSDNVLYLFTNRSMAIVSGGVALDIPVAYVSHAVCGAILYVLLRDRLVAIRERSIIADAPLSGSMLLACGPHLILISGREMSLVCTSSYAILDTIIMPYNVLAATPNGASSAILTYSMSNESIVTIAARLTVEEGKLYLKAIELPRRCTRVLKQDSHHIALCSTAIVVIRGNAVTSALQYETVCADKDALSTAPAEDKMRNILAVERNKCDCASGSAAFSRHYDRSIGITVIEPETVHPKMRGAAEHGWSLVSSAWLHTITNEEHRLSFDFREPILDFKVRDNLIFIKAGARMLKLYDMQQRRFTFIQTFNEPIQGFSVDDGLTVSFARGYAMYYILRDTISYCYSRGDARPPSVCCHPEYVLKKANMNMHADSELHAAVSSSQLYATADAIYVNQKLCSGQAKSNSACKRLTYECAEIALTLENGHLIAVADGIKRERTVELPVHAIAYHRDSIILAYDEYVAFYKLGRQNILQKSRIMIANVTGFYCAGLFIVAAVRDNAFALLLDQQVVYRSEFLFNVTAVCMFAGHLIIGSDDSYIRVYTVDDFLQVCSFFVDGIPFGLCTQRTSYLGVEREVLLYCCDGGVVGEFVEAKDTRRLLYRIENRACAYRLDQFGVIDKNLAVTQFEPINCGPGDRDLYQVLRMLNME
ncbi:hypothetical protein PAPHI01_1252 [Pancytospora philotis]|nr:hypothetical protein PAPHI01_1252 [Pancytospora philotis]